MLIEEFMVLANEEVAKWCHKRELPFLSRIHPKPSDTAMQILSDIV
jgi:exoribonuclease R